MAKKRRKKPPVRRNVENKPLAKEQSKVVRTESPKSEKSSRNTTSRRKPTSPKSRKQQRKRKEYSKEDMIFGRENYTLMIAGLVLMILGFFLMRGGSMPDADTWDADRIYSFTRITLAPILILAGLGLEIYAIFKSSDSSSDEEAATEVEIEQAEA